jgi:hypothetical protein
MENKNGKMWYKPELIIVTKNSPEENVLDGDCKLPNTPAGPARDYTVCASVVQARCLACWNSAKS